ncbi:hypothetical protein FDP41_004013 [Naegleria fowleri]|uniref:Alpha 1,4-glycosyltransferase domain-containing protein n=1 Tax=Naegleria fowleri TaxID=5763 RepID=A0A6A5BR93_NAEFO|nr:uncharacterized protein FDP41_004013 [Naegleria fowleri]KAF0976718.1 hypothetical protein FDP41_004013 [Naegleria fowleri]
MQIKYVWMSAASVIGILCLVMITSLKITIRRKSSPIATLQREAHIMHPINCSDLKKTKKLHEVPSAKGIPKIIFQSYIPSSEDELSDSMKKAMNSFKILNPNYTHKYFGDDAALNILIEHFGNDSDEVFAFRNLIPGAFKIDFWRYAMLWLFGGFYADADMLLMEPFEKWISPNASFVIPLEKIGFGFHNGFIGSVPQHPIMRIAMDMVIYNVRSKFYPGVPNRIVPKVHADLAVSGPVLLGKAINRYLNEPDEVQHNLSKIRSKNIQILGFCANENKDEDTYYTQSLSRNCVGTKLAKVKFEQFQKEHEAKSSTYTKLFQERKVFL